MNREEKLAWLKGVQVFAQVQQDTLEEVANTLDERIVPEGEFLFQEGGPGGFVFLVGEGVLETWKRDDIGTEVFLRLVNPGEMGGLTSTVVGRQRSASLRARRRTVVLTIEAERFRGGS